MAVNNMVIECSDLLINKIEDHCFSETQIEVGGFLVGTMVGNVTTVTHVLRAKKTVGKSTNLTFTHDTWSELYKDIDALKTDSVIIGWYHSHPNFGVFLSEHDEFIQSSYFKSDGQITAVVDPIRGRRGWWYSSDEKIVTYGQEVDTTKERLGISATDGDANIETVIGGAKPKGGVSLGQVIAISLAMSLLSFLAGWGVTALSAGSAGANAAEVESLRKEVQALKIAIGFVEVIPEKIPTAAIASTKPSKKATTKPTSKPTTKASTKASTKPTTKASTKPTTSPGSAIPTPDAAKAAAGPKASGSPSPKNQIIDTRAVKGASCKNLGQRGKSGDVNLVCSKNLTEAQIWMTDSDKTKFDKEIKKIKAAAEQKEKDRLADEARKKEEAEKKSAKPEDPSDSVPDKNKQTTMSNNNFCKNCGTQFGDSDRFCGSCGTPKVELCPTCGQVWDKDVEEVVQKKSISKPDPVIPKPMPPVQERKPVLIPEQPKPKVETVFAEVKKESPRVVAETVSGARVKPVYGNLYVPGKDCPNCGEKGQKGKTCSTCKGTFQPWDSHWARPMTCC